MKKTKQNKKRKHTHRQQKWSVSLPFFTSYFFYLSYSGKGHQESPIPDNILQEQREESLYHIRLLLSQKPRETSTVKQYPRETSISSRERKVQHGWCLG